MYSDIKNFLSQDNMMNYAKVILQVIVIAVVMKIVLHILNLLIDKFFKKQKNTKFGFNERKSDTLSALLKSVLRYVVYIVGILSILDTIGFETRTLLVGAGLGGIAIGFGAQSFIKDVISGFFILFEDQFSVGEYITIDDMSGIVECVGLRITKLKDFSGDLHIIPNGSITKVTNHSRGNARALVDIEVGFDADIDKVLSILDEVCESVRKDDSNIVKGPAVEGIAEIGDNGVKLRITAMTKPMTQYKVEMEIRRKVKDEFEKAKIYIPYPTRVIITKSGNN